MEVRKQVGASASATRSAMMRGQEQADRSAGNDTMKRGFIALGSALLFLLASFGGVMSAEPVRVGVSLGLSGKYQGPATMQKRGYELWRDEVNTRGGIGGRMVELVIRDDKSDPAEAVPIYRQYVTGDGVDHVFAPYSSELTAAVASLVDEAGYPMLAPGAAAETIWQQGYRGIFGMWMPASRYSQGMLRLAFEAGLRNIAILHADDPFSEGIAAGARKWGIYLQLVTVFDERFIKGTADLIPHMRRARQAGAELVIVAGHRDEAVNARQAAVALGWDPPAFFATVGPALPEWKETMGGAADGAFATTIWEPHVSVTYPRSQEFATAFRARFGIEPSYHAATAYAAGQILETAIFQAASPDREAVRSMLFDLDTYSITGRFAVDHTGMQVKRLEMILQWQDGKKEIVWPSEFRSAKPIFGSVSR